MTNTINKSKRAVVFLRVRLIPHDMEAAAARLDAQRKYCHQVANELGAEVVREYAEVGGTTDPAVREMIQAMLDDLQREPVDYVVTYGLDRLTRNMAEANRIHAAVRQARAKLVCSADADMRFTADLLFRHPAAPGLAAGRKL